jgi:hypothetical protein
MDFDRAAFAWREYERFEIELSVDVDVKGAVGRNDGCVACCWMDGKNLVVK